MTEPNADSPLVTIDADGQKCDIALRFAYDGIEHIGQLWFSGPAAGEKPIPDHGGIAGRTTEEVIERARSLTHDDLTRRLHRARAEKRKYLMLRRATDQILAKIKYMNGVAVSMRAGMLDSDGATQELDLVMKQIHEVVDSLRAVAGIES